MQPIETAQRKHGSQMLPVYVSLEPTRFPLKPSASLLEALVFLYTRQDGHDVRLEALKDAKIKEAGDHWCLRRCGSP